jgi:hypothetical protein
VRPDSGVWSWGLELERWGRAGQEAWVSGRAQVVRDGSWLEYRREGITEWFVNGTEGLEHGFTIARRPGGRLVRHGLRCGSGGNWWREGAGAGGDCFPHGGGRRGSALPEAGGDGCPGTPGGGPDGSDGEVGGN